LRIDATFARSGTRRARSGERASTTVMSTTHPTARLDARGTHARADEVRALAKDLTETATRTRGASADADADAVNRAARACGTFAALGLVDAEDVVRDGKRGGAVDAAARGAGDVTAILEEHETTLVAVLDALPEFLNAAARALAMRLRSHAPAGSSTVAEVERVLKIRELRSAFAFNKVIAKKFHEFMRVHFDADSPAGVAVAKLGWALYVCAKCESLPTFPDLYSCYHLLVAVEAFLLINAPRESLRTSLKNMVSMTAKDETTKLPDPLASLSLASKAKKDTVRAMSDAVLKVVKASFPEATMDASKHFDDVAPSDMCAQGVFDGERDVSASVVERYSRVASETFGRLAVDETLYLYTEMTSAESRGRKIIGDLADCKTTTTYGSMATPARRKRVAPFSPIRPKKIPIHGVPPSPMHSLRGIMASGVGGVAATPISQAMASASWLQDVVCGSSDLETKTAELQRFVPDNPEIVQALKKKVTNFGQRIGQAIREDALVTTMRTDISPHSTVMDELVKQRTSEVSHVFFYFLNRILKDELERIAGDKKDVNFTTLLASDRFTKSLVTCCMEVVVSTYKTSTLAFPATTHLMGIHPFDLATIIEPFVRADMSMPREIQRHFNSLEEKTLERLAWCKGSTLFEFLKTFHESARGSGGASTALPGRTAPRSPQAPKRVSTPVLNVASVAEVAAIGGTEREGSSGDDADLVMAQCQSPVRRAPTSAFSAFSSPLRGATTPRRRVSRGEPLPVRFAAVRNHTVEQPSGCDVCAFKALRMFFAKVMHLAARRLGDLASRLNLSTDVTRDIYALIEHVVYEQTNLVYNRHIDQIILVSVYGVCKASAGISSNSLQFKDIIYQYSKQPQSSEEIFWAVVLEQNDPELEVVNRGDIISFYNKVFVGRVKEFLLTLRERPARDTTNLDTDGGEQGNTVSVDDALPFGLSSPRRRLPIDNQNIYVSPMRPERVASMLHEGAPPTPRTRSLFATIGESVYAYTSPSSDFEAINRKLLMDKPKPPKGRFAPNVPKFGEHDR
jgi:retinoblastoma-like protein 1